ncbi:hypothetical protein J6590_020703 [Homalodisca vitripennis]|nr:hypothetical protein J6590_020703 [Homalodisca vitripennis]
MDECRWRRDKEQLIASHRKPPPQVPAKPPALQPADSTGPISEIILKRNQFLLVKSFCA